MRSPARAQRSAARGALRPTGSAAAVVASGVDLRRVRARAPHRRGPSPRRPPRTSRRAPRAPRSTGTPRVSATRAQAPSSGPDALDRQPRAGAGPVERPGHDLREHHPQSAAVHDAVVGGDRVAQGVHQAEPAAGERLPGEVGADEHLGPRGRVAAVGHRDRQPAPHPAQRLDGERLRDGAATPADQRLHGVDQRVDAGRRRRARRAGRGSAAGRGRRSAGWCTRRRSRPCTAAPGPPARRTRWSPRPCPPSSGPRPGAGRARRNWRRAGRCPWRRPARTRHPRATTTGRVPGKASATTAAPASTEGTVGFPGTSSTTTVGQPVAASTARASSTMPVARSPASVTTTAPPLRAPAWTSSTWSPSRASDPGPESTAGPGSWTNGVVATQAQAAAMPAERRCALQWQGPLGGAGAGRDGVHPATPVARAWRPARAPAGRRACRRGRARAPPRAGSPGARGSTRRPGRRGTPGTARRRRRPRRAGWPAAPARWTRCAG